MTSTKTDFRNVWNVCFTNKSSNFNHLWRYGFLSFNKLLLCYLFSFYLYAWSSSTERILHTTVYITHLRICRGNLPREFCVAICGENLPWLFVARICCRNFLWKIGAGICCENLPWIFCICKLIFFCICKQIFFTRKQIIFICDIFFYNTVSFYYWCSSYGSPHCRTI